MIASPRLSVIIPTYNRRALVCRAVRSVLEQQDPIGIEVIVADDGSDDGTAEGLRSEFERQLLAGKLHHLVLKRGGDPGRARNLGVQHARGEWFAFLDSDDSWLPGRLIELEPWLEPSDLILSPAAKPPPGESWLRAYLRMNLGNSSSAVIRRDLFIAVRGFPEGYFGTHPKWLQGFEDYELWLKCLAHLDSRGKLERFRPLDGHKIQIEPSSGGIGRRNLRDQMCREVVTLFKIATHVSAAEWPFIVRRILGAFKAIALG